MEFNNDYNVRRMNDIAQIKRILENKIDTKVMDLNAKVYVTKEPVPYSERLNGEYKEIKPNEKWGGLFDCGWFKLEGKVDLNLTDKQSLQLKLDLNGEALLYDNLGRPIKGFTNGSSVFDRSHGEPGKLYYQIGDYIKEDGSVELYVDAAANDLFGSLSENGVVKFCEIVKRDKKLLELYYDIDTLVSLLMSLNQERSEYKSLLEDLYDFYALVMYDEDDLYEKSRSLINKYLSGEARNDFTFSAIGHSHIDLAWLWPIRETKRKAARSFTNIFYLIEKYKDFKFGVSQPQLLEWTKEEYPEVFNQLKQYVHEGKIEVQGGMWVEADTNVTGEESLVRQMLYGTKYWKEEFGQEVKSLWLPDVFGYTAALPQIIKKSGLDYFMTIKLSWSLVNIFPHHTFNWRGIDNSEVLVHMPPEGNYNSSASVKVVKKAYEAYKEKHGSNESLLLFGIGDGGGGPGDEHMERIIRNNKISSVPKIEIKPSFEFFDSLAKNKHQYPLWNGELYLENHQGTYTSQANVKYYNRKLENKLKMLETLLVQLGEKKYEEEVKKLWKEVLLYQFHDILPGSSIKRVYDECLARYQSMDEQIDGILNEISDYKLITQYELDASIYNPLKIEADIKAKKDNYMVVTRIKPLSTTIINQVVKELEVRAFNNVIETPLLKVKFDSSGFIQSIFDKELDKEIVKKNQLANQLNIYKDYGNAWDIRDDYRKQTPSIFTLIDQVYRVFDDVYELTNVYIFNESKLTETVTIDSKTKYIEFSHDLDWKSMGYMLRSEFPLNIDTEIATFDIQFGHYSRSRKTDTSVEAAKFEVCGHNWVDISEDGIGVSLINNAKYGYFVKDDILDINLIRSTNYPAKQGDIGHHSYKYGILIHDGDFVKAKVDDFAQLLNASFPMFKRDFIIDVPIIEINNPSIEYSTIKYSYDGDGIIVRLYEKDGQDTLARIKFMKEVSKVYEVNLVEDIIKELDLSQSIELQFSKHEIKTLKFILN